MFPVKFRKTVCCIRFLRVRRTLNVLYIRSIVRRKIYGEEPDFLTNLFETASGTAYEATFIRGSNSNAIYISIISVVSGQILGLLPV